MLWELQTCNGARCERSTTALALRRHTLDVAVRASRSSIAKLGLQLVCLPPQLQLLPNRGSCACPTSGGWRAPFLIGWMVNLRGIYAICVRRTPSDRSWARKSAGRATHRPRPCRGHAMLLRCSSDTRGASSNADTAGVPCCIAVLYQRIISSFDNPEEGLQDKM